jgi:hypothetical protein
MGRGVSCCSVASASRFRRLQGDPESDKAKVESAGPVIIPELSVNAY